MIESLVESKSLQDVTSGLEMISPTTSSTNSERNLTLQ